MTDVIRVYIDNNNNFQIIVNGYCIVFLLLIILGFVVFKLIRYRINPTIEINELEVGIGNNKIKLKPNYQDKQIAYKLWVEISTRKIGLAFEDDKDVISDIYKSWYEFFGIARNIIKEIPVQKIQADNNENLVQISIKVLNQGLRPHLTKWQAKYKHWCNTIEKDKYAHLCPQESQKECSDYEELIADLKETNRRMIKYRKILYVIAFGRQESDS